MSSVASVAGPDLPVRFSAWSIASNRDSKDPFSQGGSAGGTDGASAAARTNWSESELRPCAAR